jgi:hypothetical protein
MMSRTRHSASIAIGPWATPHFGPLGEHQPELLSYAIVVSRFPIMLIIRHLQGVDILGFSGIIRNAAPHIQSIYAELVMLTRSKFSRIGLVKRHRSALHGAHNKYPDPRSRMYVFYERHDWRSLSRIPLST